MTITQQSWGAMPDGRAITLYTIKNEKGSSVCVTNLGGIITSILVPDGSGKLGDVVLGYDTAEEYLADDAFLGAMIGRYANRIREGRLRVGGAEYRLTVNNRGNTLHGGGGFHKKLWDADAAADGLHLRLISPDGEDGFPGTLSVEVVYSLSEDDELTLHMRAVSDRDTVCSLTNHSYFNLAGGGTIYDHRFRIFADRYTPYDDLLLPTGDIRPVAGTECDFRTARTLDLPKLDRNYAVRDGSPCAIAEDPASGRTLTVSSDLPAMCFYAGGPFSERRGKGGAHYAPGSAFCMEPQHFPDAPNHPQFPSAVLGAGAVYHHFIRYRFSARSGARTE